MMNLPSFPSVGKPSGSSTVDASGNPVAQGIPSAVDEDSTASLEEDDHDHVPEHDDAPEDEHDDADHEHDDDHDDDMTGGMTPPAFHSSSAMDHDEEMFKDADMGPLTLASTITPLSSPGLCSPSSGTQLDGLEHDNEMDTGMNTLMSSPTQSAFPTSLSGIPLSPTAAVQGSFVLPPTSPLFGNSSGFPGTGIIPDSPLK
ncbi:hypothetical protein OS493_025576 [Desmophyllum pertusum]|uniref:Uncharacterized protein n=1 Tax=Desmophyllum pertusum TaxID=174260 RepID=A0A9X0CFL7_9CNID|nr:hypothetical protein OS493_025576 [Desmophyllum pertusum]